MPGVAAPGVSSGIGKVVSGVAGAGGASISTGILKLTSFRCWSAKLAKGLPLNSSATRL